MILLTSFIDLGVPARLVTTLADRGISTPTPIQRSTLPDALAGRDVLGRGRTGSGKTLAFVLPVLARLAGGTRARSRAPRAVILAPTRELAGQINDVLKPLAATVGITSQTVYGGVSQHPQVTALARGVDVLVACPGRLEDLIKQGHCSLAAVEITVLDEADHMADLGFLPAVRRLLAATPDDGQRLLFSATLDHAIDALVRRFLLDPALHEADVDASSPLTMTHHLLLLERAARFSVLLDLTSAPGRTVVFTRTKHGARALARQLNGAGVPATELHGNLGQNARARNLADFHAGRVETLVATDIAARGIHVDDVTLVIHADPPADHKAYLHRSGRTARAGNHGTVVTLMTSEQQREVERMARAAGIAPSSTRVTGPDHPVLAAIAPGQRVLGSVIKPEPRTTVRPHAGSRSAAATRHRPKSGSPGRRARRPRAQQGRAATTHSAASFSARRS